MKKVFYWIAAALILFGVVEFVGAQAAKTLNPETPGKERNMVRVRNYRLSWKGNLLTNRDTSITVLTGAAQGYDTTDAFYNIAGANTICLQNIWQAVQDSCLGILRMDVSNDGTNWGSFPVSNVMTAAGVDSSDFKAATETRVHTENIASVPGAQFVRFRLEKYLSASTDTLKLQSYLLVSFNDE